MLSPAGQRPDALCSAWAFDLFRISDFAFRICWPGLRSWALNSRGSFNGCSAFEGGAAEAILNTIGYLVEFLLLLASLAVKQISLPGLFGFQATDAYAQQANGSAPGGQSP